MNKFGLIAVTAVVAAVVSFFTFKMMGTANADPANLGDTTTQSIYFAKGSANNHYASNTPEFTKAAALVTKSIVHVKIRLNRSAGHSNAYDPYYDNGPSAGQVTASGSGVIFSKDGHIVTNNHVVEGATDIQVVLTDRRIFPAKLVGRDPNTDLAVIRINTNQLQPIAIGNSDDVQIGEWVLAAGYPFSLNTTVTAGIVSAKERSIGILGNAGDGWSTSASTTSSAVEAYIQTDAAINPGNSGGALVNTSGQLIGINAAIASHSGSYEGYGFAIPVNLMQKIVNDLIKYGEVKRGLLGVSFPAPATEDEFLLRQGIKPGTVQGAYVTGVQPGSAAAAAGLKPGDIIQQIDAAIIGSSVELSERIARHHPGDRLNLKLKRADKTINATVTLKGQETAIETDKGPGLPVIASHLGATFAPLSETFKQRYRMNSGLAVTSVKPEGLFAQIGIQRGAIILSMNGKGISSVVDMAAAFKAAGNGIVRFECITPEGSLIVFNLSLGA